MVDAVKFCHLSDSHIGYFQYNLEERALDYGEALDDAFRKVAHQGPDFIIYTGDLFHEFNPKPMALHLFIKSYKKYIEPLEIPILFSSGNHDVSAVQSQRVGGTIYDFLEKILDQCKFISNEVYEVTKSDGSPLAVILGLRYQKRNVVNSLHKVLTRDKELLERNGNSVPTLLMLHEFINGMPLKIYDVEEDDIVRAWHFDYIGVGHCHKQYRNPRLGIYCPGATEHTSSSDWENKPGFFVVNMERASGWKPVIQFIELEKIRQKKKVSLPPFNNASAEEIRTQLQKVMRENNEKGAIVQYVLTGTTSEFIPLGNEQFISENDQLLRFNINKDNLKSIASQESLVEFNPDTVRSDFLREQWNITDEKQLNEFDGILEKLKVVSVNASNTDFEDQLSEVLLEIGRAKIEGKSPDFKPLKRALPIAKQKTLTETPPIILEKGERKKAEQKPGGPKRPTRQVPLLKNPKQPAAKAIARSRKKQNDIKEEQ